MKKDDCIFCKLAAGEIPSSTIYEDADFRVILDLNPAQKGHALIIPKNHYDSLYDLDEEVAAKVLPLAKKVVAHMTEVLHCDGFNIMQNNGEVSGQTVFHFHMHLIPRYKDAENKNLLTWAPGSMTPEEMSALCESLKM